MSRRRFAVLGLGQFGQALARDLAELGCEVLAVDRHQKPVEAVRDFVAMAAVADITDKQALKELFVTPFDAAIIAVGTSLEASIMATLYLKDLPVKEVWVEANVPEREEVLLRIGADKVVSPERDLGRRLAQRLANPNMLEFLPLTSGYGVVQVTAPSWTIGRTLAELDLRNQMDLGVIAVRGRDGLVVVVPGGGTTLREGDTLTVVGKDEDITRFREREEE